MSKLITSFTFALLLCINAYSQNQDWAKFSRYEKSNAEVLASGQKPLAVFMGDSITENWYKMHREFFLSHNFVGRGISAQTSSEMLVRFREDVIKLQPKYVLILAGTNDIARNNGYISLDNIFGNIVSMCELAKLHRIKPVLCSIIPSTDYFWCKEVDNPSDTIITMNKRLEAYAKANHFIYLDYHSVLKDKDNGLKPEYKLILHNGTLDAVHPGVQGYLQMEKLVLEKIR